MATLKKSSYVGDVTAVHLVRIGPQPDHALVLAGCGPQLLVYSLYSGQQLAVQRVLNGSRVHGISTLPSHGIAGVHASNHDAPQTAIPIWVVVHGDRYVHILQLQLQPTESAHANGRKGGIITRLTPVTALPARPAWVLAAHLQPVPWAALQQNDSIKDGDVDADRSASTSTRESALQHSSVAPVTEIQAPSPAGILPRVSSHQPPSPLLLVLVLADNSAEVWRLQESIPPPQTPPKHPTMPLKVGSDLGCHYHPLRAAAAPVNAAAAAEVEAAPLGKPQPYGISEPGAATTTAAVSSLNARDLPTPCLEAVWLLAGCCSSRQQLFSAAVLPRVERRSGGLRLWVAAGTMFNEVLLWCLPQLPLMQRPSGQATERRPVCESDSAAPVGPHGSTLHGSHPQSGTTAAATAVPTPGARAPDTPCQWPFDVPANPDRVKQLLYRYELLEAGLRRLESRRCASPVQGLSVGAPLLHRQAILCTTVPQSTTPSSSSSFSSMQPPSPLSTQTASMAIPGRTEGPVRLHSQLVPLPAVPTPSGCAIRGQHSSRQQQQQQGQQGQRHGMCHGPVRRPAPRAVPCPAIRVNGSRVRYVLRGHEGSVFHVAWLGSGFGSGLTGAAGGVGSDTSSGPTSVGMGMDSAMSCKGGVVGAVKEGSLGAAEMWQPGRSERGPCGEERWVLATASDDRSVRLWEAPDLDVDHGNPPSMAAIQPSSTATATILPATTTDTTPAPAPCPNSSLAPTHGCTASAAKTATAGSSPRVLTPLRTLWGHTARVWCCTGLAVTPAGISGGTSGHAAGSCSLRDSGEAEGVGNGCGGEDGGRQLLVVTGSEDGSARLWDGATGACLAALPGHRGRGIWQCAVLGTGTWYPGQRWYPGQGGGGSGGGGLLATGGADGTIRLWDLQEWVLRLATGRPDRTRGDSGDTEPGASGAGTRALSSLPAADGAASSGLYGVGGSSIGGGGVTSLFTVRLPSRLEEGLPHARNGARCLALQGGVDGVRTLFAATYSGAVERLELLPPAPASTPAPLVPRALREAVCSRGDATQPGTAAVAATAALGASGVSAVGGRSTASAGRCGGEESRGGGSSGAAGRDGGGRSGGCAGAGWERLYSAAAEGPCSCLEVCSLAANPLSGLDSGGRGGGNRGGGGGRSGGSSEGDCALLPPTLLSVGHDSGAVAVLELASPAAATSATAPQGLSEVGVGAVGVEVRCRWRATTAGAVIGAWWCAATGRDVLFTVGGDVPAVKLWRLPHAARRGVERHALCAQEHTHADRNEREGDKREGDGKEGFQERCPQRKDVLTAAATATETTSSRTTATEEGQFPAATLIAVARSPLRGRLLVADVSPSYRILLAGDQYGNVVGFWVPPSQWTQLTAGARTGLRTAVEHGPGSVNDLPCVAVFRGAVGPAAASWVRWTGGSDGVYGSGSGGGSGGDNNNYRGTGGGQYSTRPQEFLVAGRGGVLVRYRCSGVHVDPGAAGVSAGGVGEVVAEEGAPAAPGATNIINDTTYQVTVPTVVALGDSSSVAIMAVALPPSSDSDSDYTLPVAGLCPIKLECTGSQSRTGMAAIELVLPVGCPSTSAASHGQNASARNRPHYDSGVVADWAESDITTCAANTAVTASGSDGSGDGDGDGSPAGADGLMVAGFRGSDFLVVSLAPDAVECMRVAGCGGWRRTHALHVAGLDDVAFAHVGAAGDGHSPNPIGGGGGGGSAGVIHVVIRGVRTTARGLQQGAVAQPPSPSPPPGVLGLAPNRGFTGVDDVAAAAAQPSGVSREALAATCDAAGKHQPDINTSTNGGGGGADCGLLDKVRVTAPPALPPAAPPRSLPRSLHVGHHGREILCTCILPAPPPPLWVPSACSSLVQSASTSGMGPSPLSACATSPLAALPPPSPPPPPPSLCVLTGAEDGSIRRVTARPAAQPSAYGNSYGFCFEDGALVGEHAAGTAVRCMAACVLSADQAALLGAVQQSSRGVVRCGGGAKAAVTAEQHTDTPAQHTPTATAQSNGEKGSDGAFHLANSINCSSTTELLLNSTLQPTNNHHSASMSYLVISAGVKEVLMAWLVCMDTPGGPVAAAARVAPTWQPDQSVADTSPPVFFSPTGCLPSVESRWLATRPPRQGLRPRSHRASVPTPSGDRRYLALALLGVGNPTATDAPSFQHQHHQEPQQEPQPPPPPMPSRPRPPHRSSATTTTTALLAVSSSDATTSLIRWELSGGREWSQAARLQWHEHPVLSMAHLRAEEVGGGGTGRNGDGACLGSGDGGSGSGGGAVEPEGYWLATGDTAGDVALWWIPGRLHGPVYGSGGGGGGGGGGGAAAVGAVVDLRPVLVVRGVHNSGVNALVMAPTASSPAGSTPPDDSDVRQQQQQRSASCGGVDAPTDAASIVVVSGGDDQALAVLHLRIARPNRHAAGASAGAGGGVSQLVEPSSHGVAASPHSEWSAQLVGVAMRPLAHASALRGVAVAAVVAAAAVRTMGTGGGVVDGADGSLKKSQSVAAAGTGLRDCQVSSVGLDQVIRLWRLGAVDGGVSGGGGGTRARVRHEAATGPPQSQVPSTTTHGAAVPCGQQSAHITEQSRAPTTVPDADGDDSTVRRQAGDSAGCTAGGGRVGRLVVEGSREDGSLAIVRWVPSGGVAGMSRGQTPAASPARAGVDMVWPSCAPNAVPWLLSASLYDVLVGGEEPVVPELLAASKLEVPESACVEMLSVGPCVDGELSVTGARAVGAAVGGEGEGGSGGGERDGRLAGVGGRSGAAGGVGGLGSGGQRVPRLVAAVAGRGLQLVESLW